MRGKYYELTAAKYLEDEESEALEATLHKYAASNPRDTALLFLALYTGARASELLQVTPQDLNHKHATVYIRGIKDSRDREIPIPPWLFEKLANLPTEAPSDKIFRISYNRLWQIWQLYRPTKKKFHSLRHTFAIKVYRHSGDIRALQIFLGHRSLKNTMIYAEYQYRSDELKKKLFWGPASK